MLKTFTTVTLCRAIVQPTSVRFVYQTTLAPLNPTGQLLEKYIADRAPLFYRDIDSIIADLNDGLFVSAFKDTLRKLPTALNFQESHFGEILSAIFAQDVLDLTLIYSKLALATAENQNSHKIDLLLCDLKKTPVEVIFAEVKSSMKHISEGAPPGHDNSCYSKLITSVNAYSESDQAYDLAVARDRIKGFNAADRERIRKALLPYSGAPARHIGFNVIDSSTVDPDEIRVLTNRACTKPLTIDLICVDQIRTKAASTFSELRSML